LTINGSGDFTLGVDDLLAGLPATSSGPNAFDVRTIPAGLSN
jgi:hypothetical protein